jgi:hypothetical protein
MIPSNLNRGAENPEERSTPAHDSPPDSINEGGEFLDDAIRMEEMPFVYHKEKADNGGILNLF